MANSYLTVDKLAKRSLPLLRERMLLASHVNRDMDLVGQMTDMSGGGKGAGTIRVKQPVRFTTRSGATRSAQDITEHYVEVDAPDYIGVDFDIPNKDLTTDIEFLAKRYLDPIMGQIASAVDTQIASNYSKFYNTLGTPGTNPNAYSFVAAVDQRMMELNYPDADRKLMLSPGARASMTDAMKGLYEQGLTRDAVRRGELGMLSTIDVGRTNNVPAHVTGTFTAGSTPIVNGAVALNATTIVTDGWANSTPVLKAGDVFTIAGVYEVNPMTRSSTGILKQFVSRADVTSDGSGNATITVLDSSDTRGLNFSGQYQNMSAQIADNAALTVWGATGGLTGAGAEVTSYTQSLAFHKDAIWCGFFPMTDHAPGANTSVMTDDKTGISIQLTQQYDIDNHKTKYRADVLVATDVLCPELGIRLIGA